MADPPEKRSRVLTVVMYAYVIIPIVILMFFLLFTLAWGWAFD